MAVTSTYMPTTGPTIMPGSRQRLAAGSTGSAGAPTANVTGLGTAGVGSLYTDTTTGILWICTATDGATTITWTKVGLQT
jgi:hypothetical protein